MKIRTILYVSMLTLLLGGCNSNKKGLMHQEHLKQMKLWYLQKCRANNVAVIEEGSVLQRDSVVGYIDSVPLQLQKEEVVATIDALQQKTMDVGPQIKLLKDQIAVQKFS